MKIKYNNLLVLLTIVLLAIFLFFQYQVSLPSGQDSEESLFKISQGDTVLKVAEGLEKANLIKNRIYFIYYILSQGASGKLQAGNYLLDSKMSIKGIVKKIIQGNDLSQGLSVTIPEGFSLREIGETLNEMSFIQAPFSLQSIRASEFSDQFAFLREIPESSSLEGYLFPDTYRFSEDADVKEIVMKFLRNFNRKLNSDLRSEIKEQSKTINEIIIMASLLEKEVRTEEDMRLVSGILWKRLRIGMPLQVDATIIFLTGSNSLKVSQNDLKIDSAYNTYLYGGLPPAPIANPGLKAIKAAIYPQESDYFYYLSKPDGETVFSTNLQDHNLAKAKYLR